MNKDYIKNLEASQMKESVDAFSVGDTVTVYNRIKGGSNRETFTVRKISNGVGVEKTWPVHSPFVEKIEVVRKGKVRRAKIYYLRSRVGKAAKVKELVK